MGMRTRTETVHIITIDLTDEVLSKIEYGDEVRLEFSSSQAKGKFPAPTRLSWAWVQYVLGNN